jgi:hypothetical protein
VTVGIRGSRNIEIVGDVSKGTHVLSPRARISPTAPGFASTTAWTKGRGARDRE